MDTYAVPFLLISPDARAGGIGNCGTASSPDAYSIYWNAAKLAFIQKSLGISFSYSPWYNLSRRQSVYMAYASVYKRLTNSSYLACSFRYFELGSLQLLDRKITHLGTYFSRESASDLAYSKKLSDSFSCAVAVRYIYSDLAGGIPLPIGIATHIGRAWAGDASVCYNKNGISILSLKNELLVGLSITNLGTKIYYTDDNILYPGNNLPTQVRMGGSLKVHLDNYNNISVISDISRLLLPSLPFNNMQTELNNLNEAIGIEYSYASSFFVRSGYNHQDSARNHQQYFTLGLGYRYKVISFDLAYLIPIKPTYTLQNTLRISIAADLVALRKKETNMDTSKK